MRRAVIFLFGALCTASLLAQNTTVSGTVAVEQHGRELADRSGAVVWLSPVGHTVAMEKPTKVYRLMQKDKHFDPHLLVIPQGAQVEFPNKDPFFHNVFSLHDGVRFDLGLYEGGSSKLVRFSRPGASFIFCNIHPEMSAVILVMNSPYYGVTEQNGAFKFTDVEPGEYTVNVWYERAQAEQLKALTRRITVGTTPVTLDAILVHQSAGLAEHHKNKYGQDYESQPSYKVP